MIKILYLIPQLEIGGTESHVFKLSSNLDIHIFSPFVICTGSRNEEAFFAKKMIEHNIPLTWKPLFIKRFYNLFYIINFINKNQIDIIHSFSYNDVKWDVFIFIFSKVKKLITERRNLQHWRKINKTSIWEKIRNNLTSQIVANSFETAKIAIEIENIELNRIEVIHNGIFMNDINSFERLAFFKTVIDYKPDDFIISNIATLKKIKRQEDIVKALNDLCLRGIKNIKLLLVGRNDDNYKSLLEESLKKFKLHDKVFFMGEVIYPNEILLLSDIMVISSETEGLSNSVLEALFVGVPTIASKVGGNIELIKNNINGFLYKVGDYFELANMIQKYYLLSESEKLAMSDNSKKSVKKYTIESMVEKYSEIYKKI